MHKLIAAAVAAGALSAGLALAAPASATDCNEVVESINTDPDYTVSSGDKWSCAGAIEANKWTTFPGAITDKWASAPANTADKWANAPGEIAKKWSDFPKNLQDKWSGGGDEE
ncbi:hypothetical protein H5U98_08850 [Mycolicibacterium boenickei]|uniref:Transglycosylase n=1 Tax=Mycolicibacterium boenickei TaxID=146017 RepID=A0AAX3A3H2_9MYCO|nr:hypothetical protein [Mycolicibacterium boenickei]PEG59978.1 hypothetical protein CQY21_15055 [Mycolicibacterium boenickei]UNC01466.1 hypothetical protein H5U98_08850 [Mycolicibacterium boenickei]BBX91354.1 hypothetical protein MBOE_30030 [Mycolicibacterium boenickei]